MCTPSPPRATVPLRRVLGVTEFFTLAFGSIVGVGWVVVMHDWLERGGPAGAALGFVLGGLLLVPVAVVYGRLTARIPKSDSEIAYTAGLFPAWGSFAVGWMMTLGYLVVCPYEAVAVGQLAARIFPDLEQIPLYQVGGSTVYLPGLVLGLSLVLAITAVNFRGVKQSAVLQNVFTFGLIAVFFIFAALGLMRGRAVNLQPPFARAGFAGGVVATFLVLQIVPYFLAGFETVSRCAEERLPEFAAHRFTGITLAALGAAVFFYTAVILVVAGLSPWQELAATKSATLIAFQRAFDSDLLVNLILCGAILSLIKVFNGSFLAASRLIFAMGRAGLVARGFADVDVRFHTPRWAIAFVGLLAAAGCLFGKSVLVPIAEVGSFAYAVGWFAACAAYCGGAGGKTPLGQRLLGLSGVTVTLLIMGMKLIPGVPGSFSAVEYAVLASWAALGLALWCFRPGRRPPFPNETGGGS
jgi:amino acid transporter